MIALLSSIGETTFVNECHNGCYGAYVASPSKSSNLFLNAMFGGTR
jgi:hypothetical protein